MRFYVGVIGRPDRQKRETFGGLEGHAGLASFDRS